MSRESDIRRTLEELLMEQTALGRFYGCAGVARDGQWIAFYVTGERNDSWEETTVLPIGSISKQFTAVALLQLAATGTVSLDHSVGEYLPDLRAPWCDRVTLRQLLCHSGGVPSVFTGHAGVVDPPLVEAQQPVDVSDLLARFASLELRFESGARFEYSNSGYTLIASVVEHVTGTPYATHMREAVFEPAGLRRTAIYDAEEQPPGLVQGRIGGRLAPMLHPTWQRGSGDIVSSMDDLLTWDTALREGRVLPADWRQEMESPGRTCETVNTGYGYGVRLCGERGGTAVYHDSALPGLLGVYRRQPAEKIVVAAFVNEVPGTACMPDGTRRLNRLAKELGGIASGRRRRLFPVRLPAVPPPTEEPEDAGGRYTLDAERYLHIHRQQGQLYARLEGRPATLSGLVNDDLALPSGLALERFLDALRSGRFDKAERCLSVPGLRALGAGGLQRLWMESVVGHLGDLLSYDVIQRETSIARARCRFVLSTLDMQAVCFAAGRIESFHLVPVGLGPATLEYPLIPLGGTRFLVDGYPFGTSDVLLCFEDSDAAVVGVRLEGDRMLRAARYVPDTTP